MMITRYLFIVLTMLAVGFSVDAQRRITPVEPNSKAKEAEASEKSKMAGLVQYKDSQGNTILLDTITGREVPDTAQVKEVAVNVYPKFHAVSVGVNIWDPLMRCFGNNYGGGEVWAELSLYNRFKPVVEIGFGSANDTPDDGNYTYKSSTALYCRLGMNYNFFYRSDSRYQVYLGLRYGFTNFSYDVTAALRPGYWDETEPFRIPSQKSTVGYMEFLAGLRVEIVKNFSLGWALKYHSILHESANKYGDPWYVPGYGMRRSSFAGAINLIYTFNLGGRKLSAVEAAATSED